MLLRILIVLSVISFCNSVFATDYYVTQSGSGTEGGLTYVNSDSVATFNAGAAPYNNLDGDTVYLCDTITSRIVVPDGGSVGSPVTFRGDYSGHSGIIDGGNAISECFLAESKSYITVTDLTMTDAQNDIIKFNSLGVATSNITVKNCDISFTNTNGTSGIVFIGNLFSASSIYDNTIHNIPGNGIYVGNGTSCTDCTGFSIYNNTVIDNGYGGGGAEPHGRGIYLDNVVSSSVYRNFMKNNQGCGLKVNDDTDNCSFYYNIIVQTTTGDKGGIYIEIAGPSGNTFYNNTIYIGASGWGYMPAILLYAQATSNTFRNNIFYADENSLWINDTQANYDTWNNDFDYNLYYTTTGQEVRFSAGEVDFAVWQGYDVTQYDDNGLNSDPLFNSTTYFLPKYNSPAIDAGTDVSLTIDYTGGKVPRGAGVDIGAYEYCPNAIRDSMKKILGGLGINL